MGRRRQPPKLLSRVIRAVAGLKETRGSTAGDIANQVRVQLTASGAMTRNVALQIKRALKYAVDIGALTVKYGRYKMAHRRHIIPVDSLELAMDCRTRKARQAKKRKTQKPKRRRHKSTTDSRRTKKRIRHGQDKRNKKRASSVEDNEKLLQKKVEPPTQEPASAENEQRSQIPSSHHYPSPHDQTQELEERRKLRTGTDRNQTPYPEYNESMSGDDKKSLTKVPGKARRPRPPILPTGRRRYARHRSADSRTNQEGNELENVCNELNLPEGERRKRVRSSRRSQRSQKRKKYKKRKCSMDWDSSDDDFEEFIQNNF